MCLVYQKAQLNCKTSNSQNECLECEEGYFLDIDDNFCRQQMTIPKCETYAPKGDYCSSCESGYHRSEDFKTCLVNPTGV